MPIKRTALVMHWPNMLMLSGSAFETEDNRRSSLRCRCTSSLEELTYRRHLCTVDLRKHLKTADFERNTQRCSTCSGDIRGSGRRGGDIFPGHWSPHCCRHWRAASREPRSTQFLFQSLSIAIERGNAASVVGIASSDCCLNDYEFYL